MLRFRIPSYSKFWATKLALIASLGCGVLASADSSVVTHVKRPCRIEEAWQFSPAMTSILPPANIEEFAGLLQGKDHPLRAFGEGIALGSSKEAAEVAFGDYWKGRAFYAANEYALAIEQFNTLIERKPNLGAYPYQLAAMSCLQMIHEKYPVSVYSEESLNNLPNYFKSGIIPEEFKTPLWEAGVHMVMRALKHNKPKQTVEQLVEYLNGSGPYEAFVRAMWTVETHRPEEAALFLTGLSFSETLPPSIRARQNDLRIMNARVLYELGKNDDAAKSLDVVDRKSNSFISALVQQTSNDLARQQYTKAVGASIALQSGQLRRTFAPEALMVSAIALNELCLYPESLQMLQTFRKHYEKTFRWLLERTGKREKADEKYYPLALEFIKGDNPAIPERVVTEWVRSPGFISRQQAINLSFAQERLVPNLVKEATAYHYAEVLKLGALRLEYERKLAHLIAERDAQFAAVKNEELKKATKEENQAKKFANQRTREKAKVLAESKDTLKKLADAEKLAKKSAVDSETAAKRAVDADLASKGAAEAEVLAQKNSAAADEVAKKAATESEEKGKILADRNKDSSKANADAKAAADTAADAVAKAKPANDKAKATAKAAVEAKDLAKKLADAEVNAKKTAGDADSAAKKIVDSIKEFVAKTTAAKDVKKQAADKLVMMTKTASDAKEVARKADDSAKESAKKIAEAKSMEKKASQAKDDAVKAADNEASAKKKIVTTSETAKKAVQDEAAAKFASSEAADSAKQLADVAKESAKKAAEATKADVAAQTLVKNALKKKKGARAVASDTTELREKAAEARAEAREAKAEAAADAKKAASAQATAKKASAAVETGAKKVLETDMAAKKAVIEADASVIKTVDAQAKAKKLADDADSSAKLAAAAEAASNKAVADAQAALKIANDNESAAKKASSSADDGAKSAQDEENKVRKSAEAAEANAKKMASNASDAAKKAADQAQVQTKKEAEAADAAKKLAEVEANVKTFTDTSKEANKKAADAKDAAKKAAEVDAAAKKIAATTGGEAKKLGEKHKQATATAKFKASEFEKRTSESIKAAKKAEDTAARAKQIAEESKEVLERVAVAEENLKKAIDEHKAAKKVMDDARVVWKKAAEKARLSAKKAAELDAKAKLPASNLANIPRPKRPDAENATPAMIDLFNALEIQEWRHDRLTTALPIYRERLLRFKEAAPKNRESLITEIEKQFRLTNDKMMRRLAMVLENNDLIEAEIWNGASADLVWQNAHPEFQGMVKSGEIDAAANNKGEVKTRSDVYVWGKTKTTLEQGQDEVWEDELGNVMASLEDNCGNKEKYMNLKRKPK